MRRCAPTKGLSWENVEVKDQRTAQHQRLYFGAVVLRRTTHAAMHERVQICLTSFLDTCPKSDLFGLNRLRCYISMTLGLDT